jgi:predicted HicB family RNase H-like nuclease
VSTLTIRLTDTKHQLLKALARARGVSLNKLVEDMGHRRSREA